MGEEEDIVQAFLIECFQRLDGLAADFARLERDPEDVEAQLTIFRILHTIKGESGFLGLEKLEALTLVGERLMAGLRDGRLAFDPEMTAALRATADAIRAMVTSIEQTGGEGDDDYAELIQTLQRLDQCGVVAD